MTVAEFEAALEFVAKFLRSEMPRKREADLTIFFRIRDEQLLPIETTVVVRAEPTAQPKPGPVRK